MKRIAFIFAVLTVLICLCSFSSAASVVSSEGRAPFYDTDENAWYFKGMEFCYINGYVKGTGRYIFEPSASISREGAVCILARASGEDVSGYTENHFNDTKAGEWYSKELSWAYEKGYINGIGKGKFGLGRTLTREALAVIIYNYSSENALIGENDAGLSCFGDKRDISEWAVKGIEWCVSNKLLEGNDKGLLMPKESVTRAQTAKIFKSFVENILISECEHSLTEPSCTKGAECCKCGIVFELPLGHLCEALSCVSGGECQRCGSFLSKDDGIHRFLSASCTKPATCRDCKTSYGNKLDHIYIPATCTTPKSCSRCYLTFGSSLGHTTYNGKCSRCGTENYRKKILDVPYIYQGNGYPNGCEAVSAVMALRYLGINISVDYFIDNLLPMGPAPTVGDIGPDPDKVYCGDPRSSGGWGCYSPVIAKAFESYLNKDHYSFYHSYDYSLKDLCDKYIDNGIPVIVWGTLNMENATSCAKWKTSGGKTISYNRRLHCLVLVGYDKDNYYFNDPWNGKAVAYSKERAQRAFEILGNQSIAVMKK